MCRRVECAVCGRPTYAGCGAHVEQVLRDVPKADRCRCDEQKSASLKSPPHDAHGVPPEETGRRRWSWPFSGW